jgi:hypothetical protein
MAGFTDLVLQAQPSLVHKCIASATEGRSWRWEITGFVDSLGADVDLTSATCLCVVQDKVDGVNVVALTATGSPGKVTITAIPSLTAGLVPAGQRDRDCVWSLTLTLAGSQVQVWGPTHSPFKIEAA